METEFCLATSTDIDILVSFMRQFYAIDHYPFEESAARTALKQMIDDRGLGRIWLITKNGEAIGYIVVAFGFSLEYHGRDAFIDELFIVEDQRNLGIGAKAVQFVIDNCPDLGVRALHLEVERSNMAAQALYRKAGFKDHERYLMTRMVNIN